MRRPAGRVRRHRTHRRRRPQPTRGATWQAHTPRRRRPASPRLARGARAAAAPRAPPPPARPRAAAVLRLPPPAAVLLRRPRRRLAPLPSLPPVAAPRAPSSSAEPRLRPLLSLAVSLLSTPAVASAPARSPGEPGPRPIRSETSRETSS
nr:translation initiation factor IF-2-like [Aegilops tauschii subsp. strangulata]